MHNTWGLECQAVCTSFTTGNDVWLCYWWNWRTDTTDTQTGSPAEPETWRMSTGWESSMGPPRLQKSGIITNFASEDTQLIVWLHPIASEALEVVTFV